MQKITFSILTAMILACTALMPSRTAAVQPHKPEPVLLADFSSKAGKAWTETFF